MPGRSESTDGDPLSKDAFVKRANAICRESRAEARQIPAPSLADPVAVEESILQAATIQRRALRALRGLVPPETDTPGIENWLGLVGDTIDEMEAIAEAVAAGDREEITAATERGDALTADAEAFTEAYGLFDCSTADPPDDEPGAGGTDTQPGTSTSTTIGTAVGTTTGG